MRNAGRILGRLGNGRMVGHHNGLLVESPGPRSQSTMERMRSSGQIGVEPADRTLQGTVSTNYYTEYKRPFFLI